MSTAIIIGLFVLGIILGIALGYYLLKGRAKAWLRQWKEKHEEEIRKDVIKRSRATLKGKVGEQMAPLYSEFNHEPSEARFIGSPIDYVIFDGHSKEEPEAITFLDVKTGEGARLSPIQKGFKEVVESGKVRWETLRIEDIE